MMRMMRDTACGRRRLWTATATLLSITLASSSSPAQHTQRGGVLGGLAGAAAGAIIGDHNDKAGAGAAIGGAVGIVAGSLLGQAADQEHAWAASAYHQHRHQQVQHAMSLEDVIAMRQNGLSDSLVISTLQSHGLQRPLEVADVLYLSRAGVSDLVIQAMQRAPVAGTGLAYAQRTVQHRPYPTTRVYIATPFPVYGRPPIYHAHPRCGW